MASRFPSRASSHSSSAHEQQREFSAEWPRQFGAAGARRSEVKGARSSRIIYADSPDAVSLWRKCRSNRSNRRLRDSRFRWIVVLAPRTEATQQRVNADHAVPAEQQRRSRAALFVRTRAVENHVAVAGNFSVAKRQFIQRDVPCAADQQWFHFEVRVRTQVEDDLKLRISLADLVLYFPDNPILQSPVYVPNSENSIRRGQ